jgi:hypothetical protein
MNPVATARVGGESIGARHAMSRKNRQQKTPVVCRGFLLVGLLGMTPTALTHDRD